MTARTVAGLSPDRRLYGPMQLAAAVGLWDFQLQRAVSMELIPARCAARGWRPAVVADVLARRDAIVAAVGEVEDQGAVRAAALLTDRFGTEVPSDAVAELGRRGVLPIVSEYKGHAVYCGRALDALDVVADRQLVVDAVTVGQLYTADQAAARMRIRRADFDHLVRAGWLEEVTHVRSSWQRRSDPPTVPLYREGDLRVVLEHPAIDWDEVRSTPAGRPSPLVRLGRIGSARVGVNRQVSGMVTGP